VCPYLDAQTPVPRHDEQPAVSGAKSGGSAGPPYRPLRAACLRPVRRLLRKNHAGEYRPVPTGTRTPLSRLSAMTETAKAAKDRALWLDVAGHGLLSRFHDGCRCPWCTSRAREPQCLCPDCLEVRTTGFTSHRPRFGPLRNPSEWVMDSPDLAAGKRLLDAAKVQGFTFHRVAPGPDGPLWGVRRSDYSACLHSDTPVMG
jgi:hypothetical protein